MSFFYNIIQTIQFTIQYNIIFFLLQYNTNNTIYNTIQYNTILDYEKTLLLLYHFICVNYIVVLHNVAETTIFLSLEY